MYRFRSALAGLAASVLLFAPLSACRGADDDEAERPRTTVPYEEPVSDGASQ